MADLAYVRKSLQVPMTYTTAPRSTNAPPPEQPPHTKKVKRPAVPILRHTIRLWVLGAAGVPAALFNEGQSAIAYINRAANIADAASYLSSIHAFYWYQ